jgi:hypothetical protein
MRGPLLLLLSPCCDLLLMLKLSEEPAFARHPDLPLSTPPTSSWPIAHGQLERAPRPGETPTWGSQSHHPLVEAALSATVTIADLMMLT